MQFSLYEAGDMVQTPNGKAMVIEDQRVGSSYIRVQFDGSESLNTYNVKDVWIIRSA